MTIYLRMIRMIKPYWKTMLGGLLASLVYVVFNSGSVWLTASFMNVVFQEPQPAIERATETTTDLNSRLKNWTNQVILRQDRMTSLKFLCLAIFIAFLLKSIFFYIKNITIGYDELRLITDIRDLLYAKLHELSMAFFDRKRSGEIASILLNDVGVMRRSFSSNVNQLIVEPINIASFIVILFIISWKLTLIAIIILPFSALTITRIGQSIRRKSVRTSKQIAGIMSILNETLHGMRIVKAFAMEEFEKRRFFRETQRYFGLLFRRVKLSAVSTPLNETLGVFIGVILLWYGGRQVLLGQGMDSEDFVRYILMLFAIMQPVKNLNKINVEIQQGIASAGRVFTILDEKPEIVERTNALQLTGFSDRIVYDHVYFRYERSTEDVLSDISLTVTKGQIVAFVGHSGAGKSTLVDLLPRFYDPIAGAIRIDGHDIREVTLGSLRSLMGIVTQETILFNDTVLNNIAYGLTNVDPRQVEAAAEAANAIEFIREMPAGFETIIGEKGVLLSGGQRQRLAIARALLKNPLILILDEATSSLDTESEHKVQSAIDRLVQNRTVFVIAHRLSTIINADQIVVIDKARIVETGTHQQLISNPESLYAYLYQLQFHAS